jgi:hypothetical protein
VGERDRYIFILSTSEALRALLLSPWPDSSAPRTELTAASPPQVAFLTTTNEGVRGLESGIALTMNNELRASSRLRSHRV